MGPHISKKWGWDESFQRKLHEQMCSEKPWFIICFGSESIGTVSIHELPEHTRFGEFYLLDEYRNKGIGSRILKEFLVECDEKSICRVSRYLAVLKLHLDISLFNPHISLSIIINI